MLSNRSEWCDASINAVEVLEGMRPDYGNKLAFLKAELAKAKAIPTDKPREALEALFEVLYLYAQIPFDDNSRTLVAWISGCIRHAVTDCRNAGIAVVADETGIYFPK